MTYEQLIGAVLAVGAIACGVVLVVLFRWAATWWTEWQDAPGDRRRSRAAGPARGLRLAHRRWPLSVTAT